MDGIERRTAYNKGLAKAGLIEIIEYLNFYQHLCLNQADVFQMSHHRQYVNRWQQAYRNTLRIVSFNLLTFAFRPSFSFD